MIQLVSAVVQVQSLAQCSGLKDVVAARIQSLAWGLASAAGVATKKEGGIAAEWWGCPLVLTTWRQLPELSDV